MTRDTSTFRGVALRRACRWYLGGKILGFCLVDEMTEANRGARLAICAVTYEQHIDFQTFKKSCYVLVWLVDYDAETETYRLEMATRDDPKQYSGPTDGVDYNLVTGSFSYRV